MQVFRSFVFAAAVVAGVVFSSSAVDSWYWIGTTKTPDGSSTAIQYGYTILAAANWVNVKTGEHGIPADGDIAIVDKAHAQHEFGQDFGSRALGGIIYEDKTVNGSQGTITLQAGGQGIQIKCDSTVYWNSECKLVGSGETEIHVAYANQEFQLQKNFLAGDGTTIRKTGPGTLNLFCNGYHSRTYQPKKTLFQDGKIIIKVYEGNPSVGHEFWFDSNVSTLGLVLDYKRDGAGDYGPERYNWVIKDGGLYESASVQNHTHYISSTLTNRIVFTGTPKTSPQTFTGRLTGNAGLTWSPSNDSVFCFSGGDNDSSGFLTVTGGTVEMADGAKFTKLANLLVDGANSRFAVADAASSVCTVPVELTNGGKLAVPVGTKLCVKSVTVGGGTLTSGVYTGTGVIGTTADWVDGAGTVIVGSVSASEAAAVAATWNGTGNATTLANWNGATELPVLNDGSAQVTVAGGSSFVADTDVWVKGFTLGVTPFAFSAAAGKELWIGSSGISASGKAVTVGAADGCVVAAGAQTWNIGNGTLAINGDVGTIGNDALWIKGTGKNALDLNAATPSWTAPVFITNMVVNFKASGALGPTGANPAYLYQAPTFTGGITIDRDLWVAAGQTITPTTAGDLTFNGFVCSTNGQGVNITAPANTRIVFNKLMMSRNGGTMQGAGTIVFKDSCHFRDRPSMSGTVTVELWKDQNRLIGNYGTFSGGRLKAMGPYVITKANAIRQAKDGGGGSKDGTQQTDINAKGDFILDLNGFDQSLNQLAAHANGTSSGGHVTSATSATLHLQTDKSYLAKHNYTYGFSETSLSTADQYGYETADKGYWEGGVTLSYEAAAGMVRSMMRPSSSTGNVEVVSGTLVFLRRAKTANETFDLKGGSVNPYYRLANEDGAWTNATKAVVKGGILKLEHGKAFGKETAFELNSAGKLQLEDGVRQSCASLTLNGTEAPVGTYGSTESDAQYKDDAYFTGTGVLKVGKVGMYILIR